jgi:hypothetical protein
MEDSFVSGSADSRHLYTREVVNYELILSLHAGSVYSKTVFSKVQVWFEFVDSRLQ